MLFSFFRWFQHSKFGPTAKFCLIIHPVYFEILLLCLVGTKLLLVLCNLWVLFNLIPLMVFLWTLENFPHTHVQSEFIWEPSADLWSTLYVVLSSPVVCPVNSSHLVFSTEGDCQSLFGCLTPHCSLETLAMS